MKLLTLLMAVAVLGPATAAAADEKPNILFIFADDQCFDTVRALGNEEIETPHLDRLVEEGTTFTHCYNMGGWNGAICVASRTMINTGRFLWHAREVWESSEQERQAGRFWSEYMKSAGYRTYFTGKWHVRANAERAFDVARNVRGGMPKQTPEGYNRPLPGQPDTWSPYDPKFGGFWEGGTHWSEVVADDALDYLGDARQREQPFFMYVAFNAPHDPRQSPKEYVDRYPAASLAIPENFVPEYPYKDEIGCSEQLRDERLAPFPRTPESIQVHRQEYYAIITHMDAQIGRILKALDESGKRENTWIFFTADHGLAVGQHGLLGKQNMYDHSVRVPLMVVGPGVEAGGKIDTPVYLQDIMPTTLELAGVPKPNHVEFHSLLPLLAGEDVRPYEAVYCGYIDLQRMVVEDGYKLILYPQAKVARLYHVDEDPLELRDLIEEPGSAAIAQKLFGRLLELQRQTGDSLDLKSVYPALLSQAGVPDT
jgi:arylsulfatase A-like enzyme